MTRRSRRGPSCDNGARERGPDDHADPQGAAPGVRRRPLAPRRPHPADRQGAADRHEPPPGAAARRGRASSSPGPSAPPCSCLPVRTWFGQNDEIDAPARRSCDAAEPVNGDLQQEVDELQTDDGIVAGRPRGARLHPGRRAPRDGRRPARRSRPTCPTGGRTGRSSRSSPCVPRRPRRNRPGAERAPQLACAVVRSWAVVAVVLVALGRCGLRRFDEGRDVARRAGVRGHDPRRPRRASRRRAEPERRCRWSTSSASARRRSPPTCRPTSPPSSTRTPTSASPTSARRRCSRTRTTCRSATTGVLVAVGAVPPDDDPVDVHVEIYRSEVDWSKLVLTIGRRSSQWTVTSESVVPPERVLRAGRRRRRPSSRSSAARRGGLGVGDGRSGRRSAPSSEPIDERAAWAIAQSTSRVSSGHVDRAAARSASRRTIVVGVEHEPGRAGEVDDAGELGDGEAVEVAAVPLDGVVDAPAGHLDRVERILDVGGVALAQGVARTARRPARRNTASDDQAVADRDGDGRRRRWRRRPSRAGTGSRSGRTSGRGSPSGRGSGPSRRSPGGRRRRRRRARTTPAARAGVTGRGRRTPARRRGRRARRP